MVMIGRKRIRRGQREFTNCYHIPSIRGTTHWFVWFGHPVAYQSLPTRTYKQDGVFGLVGPPFTNTYHSPDLGADLPCVAFTKHHRLAVRIEHDTLDDDDYVSCGVIMYDDQAQ